jgi:hypothetical protein
MSLAGPSAGAGEAVGDWVSLAEVGEKGLVDDGTAEVTEDRGLVFIRCTSCWTVSVWDSWSQPMYTFMVFHELAALRVVSLYTALATAVGASILFRRWW